MTDTIKKFIGINALVVLLAGVVLGVTVMGVLAMKAQAQEPAAAVQTEGAPAALGDSAVSSAFWAAAVSVCVSCVAAGIAVGMTGSAAIGAISERPELMGRTILFVGLAEGIAIYGLIIAIMILGKV
jgi:V/A-type H+-transporting ATPase subunit K